MDGRRNKKKCSSCKEQKKFSDFNKNKAKKDGYCNQCKSCEKGYRLANIEKFKKRDRDYYEANIERYKERDREYYIENREKKKEYQKEYYESNKREIIEKKKEYERNLYRTDDFYKLKYNVRRSIRRYLKDGKSKSSEAILGCTWEFLQTWLDISGFSKPHYDHIIPLSWAKNKEEVCLLNHYSNFQILEAKDNHSKGDRYCNRRNLITVLLNHPNTKAILEIVEGKNILQNN